MSYQETGLSKCVDYSPCLYPVLASRAQHWRSGPSGPSWLPAGMAEQRKDVSQEKGDGRLGMEADIPVSSWPGTDSGPSSVLPRGSLCQKL